MPYLVRPLPITLAAASFWMASATLAAAPPPVPAASASAPIGRAAASAPMVLAPAGTQRPVLLPKVAPSMAARPAEAAASSAPTKAPAQTRSAPAGRWVALDVGHRPGEGSRSASGLAEHNFNLRFAAALEAQLRAQGIPVRRLPTNLSLADRAQRAAGASLVVSVHHDASKPAGGAVAKPVALGAAAAKSTAAGSGYQLRIGQPAALPCARLVAKQLQTAGRHFGAAGSAPWADKSFGVLGQGEGALLQQAGVPALQVSLADIANPAEERLAAKPQWVKQQAAAVARGVGLCLAPQAASTGRTALPGRPGGQGAGQA